jgi:hypothetical protein
MGGVDDFFGSVGLGGGTGLGTPRAADQGRLEEEREALAGFYVHKATSTIVLVLPNHRGDMELWRPTSKGHRPDKHSTKKAPRQVDRMRQMLQRDYRLIYKGFGFVAAGAGGAGDGGVTADQNAQGQSGLEMAKNFWEGGYGEPETHHLVSGPILRWWSMLKEMLETSDKGVAMGMVEDERGRKKKGQKKMKIVRVQITGTDTRVIGVDVPVDKITAVLEELKKPPEEEDDRGGAGGGGVGVGMPRSMMADDASRRVALQQQWQQREWMNQQREKQEAARYQMQEQTHKQAVAANYAKLMQQQEQLDPGDGGGQQFDMHNIDGGQQMQMQQGQHMHGMAGQQQPRSMSMSGMEIDLTEGMEDDDGGGGGGSSGGRRRGGANEKEADEGDEDGDEDGLGLDDILGGGEDEPIEIDFESDDEGGNDEGGNDLHLNPPEMQLSPEQLMQRGMWTENHERLADFYRKFDPSQVDSVHSKLQIYQDVQGLMNGLGAKYGEAPPLLPGHMNRPFIQQQQQQQQQQHAPEALLMPMPIEMPAFASMHTTQSLHLSEQTAPPAQGRQATGMPPLIRKSSIESEISFGEF